MIFLKLFLFFIIVTPLLPQDIKASECLGAQEFFSPHDSNKKKFNKIKFAKKGIQGVLNSFGANDLNEAGKNGGFLKFVVFLHDTNPAQIVFLDNKIYPFHHAFIKENASALDQLKSFRGMSEEEIDNKVLYEHKGIMFGVISDVKHDEFTKDLPTGNFEINSHSEAHSAEQIGDVLKLLKKGLSKEWGARWKKMHLSYQPLPSLEQSVKFHQLDFERLNIPVIFRENTGQMRDDIPIHYGWNIGKLKFYDRMTFSKAWKDGEISSNDILAIDFIPQELPPIGGLILSKMPGPASHIIMFSQSLDIPVLYMKPSTLSEYRPLMGMNVLFKLQDEYKDYRITINAPISSHAVQMAKKLKDLRIKDLKTEDYASYGPKKAKKVSNMAPSDFKYYGGKSIGLSKVASIYPDNVDKKSIAFSTYYYLKYIETLEIGGLKLTDFIKNLEEKYSTQSLAKSIYQLSKIRKTIMDGTFSTELHNDLINEYLKFFDNETNVFIRSSAKEDLKNFNGSGLFDSLPAKFDNLEEVIKNVFASTFNDRAFLAQRVFGISSYSSPMSFLIQSDLKFRPGVIANAVVVTMGDEVMISSFKGIKNKAVDSLSDELVPETTIVKMLPSQSLHISSFDSGSEGTYKRQNLTKKIYKQIYEMALRLKKKMGMETDIDIELAVLTNKSGEKKIQINQARAVPKSIAKLNKMERFFVGGKGFILQSAIFSPGASNPASILLTPKLITMDIDSNVFSLDDKVKKTQSLIISQLKLITKDDIHFGFDNIKMFFKGEYVEKFNTSNVGLPRSVIFESEVLDHPEYTNFKIKVVLPIAAGEKEADYHRILSTKDAFISIIFDPNQGQKLSDIDYPRNKIEEVSLIESSKMADSRQQYDDKKYTSLNNEVQVEYKKLGSSGSSFIYSGHDAKILLPKEILGVSKKLILSNPAHMAHTAYHHNRVDYWSFDLYKADNITKSDIKKLKNKGIRYYTTEIVQGSGL